MWVDYIPYSPTYASASSIADDIVVTGIGSLGNPTFLYPLANTNYQTWFIDLGIPEPRVDGFFPSTSWIKPLINPSDVPNDKGEPSYGYRVLMYRPDGTTAVSYGGTFYDVDYFSGLVRFEKGATPIDLSTVSGLGFQFNKVNFESAGDKSAYINNSSTGGPRVNAFQYVGIKLSDVDIGATYSAGAGITISNNLISVSVDDETIGFDDIMISMLKVKQYMIDSHR